MDYRKAIAEYTICNTAKVVYTQEGSTFAMSFKNTTQVKGYNKMTIE